MYVRTYLLIFCDLEFVGKVSERNWYTGTVKVRIIYVFVHMYIDKNDILRIDVPVDGKQKGICDKKVSYFVSRLSNSFLYVKNELESETFIGEISFLFSI